MVILSEARASAVSSAERIWRPPRLFNGAFSSIHSSSASILRKAASIKCLQSFRHGTKFLRWRPDKAPKQCTVKQVSRESGLPLLLVQ